MVQVAVGRRRQLQRAETDVVQSLVVDAVGLIGVLDQLVDGQRRVVRLHHRVRHLTSGQFKHAAKLARGCGLLLHTWRGPCVSDSRVVRLNHRIGQKQPQYTRWHRNNADHRGSHSCLTFHKVVSFPGPDLAGGKPGPSVIVGR